MGHALETMAAHGLAAEAGRAADHQFHALILEAIGNELLVSLSASIAAAVHWTTFFKYRHEKQPRDLMPEHQALFEAIADGDAAAARDATMTLVQQTQLNTKAAIKLGE